MTLASVALAGPVAAFIQVVLIDVALAGDNAVAVGMAAAGLPKKQRRQAIVLGLGLAVAMLIGFAIVAVQLLKVVGLLLAGGVLLLWVCWKMWGELHDHGHVAHDHGEDNFTEALSPDSTATEDAATSLGTAAAPAAAPPATAAAGAGKVKKPKTLGGALVQILIADLSMSLDNVLAVAGAAREHPVVMVFGLLLSITLMGLAASWIAKLLQKWRWIGYLGFGIVLFVSLHMIWEGHRAVVVDLHKVAEYNAVAPAQLDINAEEAAKLAKH